MESELIDHDDREIAGPVVSIVCLTYNHARYIQRALDSFVAQTGIESFEVIVADDASTDGTSEIVRDYARRFPDVIKPLIQPVNVGAAENFTRASRLIRAPYVAICDGDDYFIANTKLSRQVAMLDADSGLSICFTLARMEFGDRSSADFVFPSPDVTRGKARFELKDLLQTNFIPSCSVVYRWLFGSAPVEHAVPKGILPGDYYLHLLHAREGDIGFLNDVTVVYFRHADGMWWQYDRDWDQQNLKHGFSELKFHIAVSQFVCTGESARAYEQDRVIPFTALLIMLLLRHSEFDRLDELKRLGPNTFHEAVRRLSI